MHFTNRTAILVFLQRPSGSGHTISMEEGVQADWDTGLSEYRASLKSIVSHNFLNSTYQSIGGIHWYFQESYLGLFPIFPYFQRKLHSNNAPSSPRVPGYSWCTLKSESCPIDCGEVVTCASTRLPRRSSVLGILVPKETHDPQQIHRKNSLLWPYVMEHIRNFITIIIIIITITIIIIIIIRSHGFIHSHPASMAKATITPATTAVPRRVAAPAKQMRWAARTCWNSRWPSSKTTTKHHGEYSLW